MNGATEATLAELLATAQAMNVNMIKLQGLFKNMTPGGGPGGGGGSVGSASLASSINPVGVAFGILKGAAGAVSSVFGVMTSILGKVISVFTSTAENLYSFAASTALGTSKLSEFYRAFQDIPVIGRAFGIMADVLQYQEQLLEFFQQVAFNGANFSGSLTDMRAAASRSYMSMQDLAEVVKNSSEVFANLGGTAQSGVNRFVEIQNKMLGPRSEYGNLMAGLGYTAKGTAELLASYMKMQGTMNKEEMQSTDAIIKGTVAYAKELDTLSQLTGKNSADLRKRAEKIASEEAFEAFKLTKDTNTVNAMNAAIMNMLETGGEEAAVQLRNSFMGLNTAQSEGQRAMAVMTNNGVTELNNQVLRMVKEGKSTAEIGEAVRRGNLENGKRYTANIQQLGATGATMANNILITSGATMTKFARDQVDLSKLNAKEREARERQIKSQTSQAQALERASQGFRDFGNQLLMTVWGIIAPMATPLKDFAGFITKLVVDFAVLAAKLTGSDGFKAAISGVVNWIKTTFTSLGDSKNASDFFGRLGKQIDIAVDAIKPILVSIFEKFIEFFKPYAIDMLHTIEDYMNNVMYQKTGTLFGAEDPETRKKQRAYEKLVLAAQSLSDRAVSLSTSGNNSEKVAQLNAEAVRKMEEAQRAQREWEKAQGKGKGQVRASDGSFMRHSGTIGMTGSWWEKSDATLDVQQGESVVTKGQMAQIVDTASQNSLAQGIQQLNSLVAQQVKYAKEAAEYARRNVDATKGLNGNLFA